ncbi:MAG: ATP-dependent helicase [Bacteroidetes bacterium]|nr:MAG: ATP-dependent helicase [Bacteroidota bacterium]
MSYSNNQKRRQRNNSSPVRYNGTGSTNRNRSNSNTAKKKSTLDPSLLVKEANHSVVAKVFQSERQISDLPISAKLIQALESKGYKKPTEIQDRTLETLLTGRDLLGIAQTGTGKTGAFLVPIIEQLLHKRVNPYALVVVPTRELALQVEEEFRSMTRGLGLYSACFIGGTNINNNLRALQRNSHVVIATPGRLLDLTDRKAINLGKFKTLVLDEFDRMLDMGFIRDVKRILEAMQQRTQTMLFSATLDKSQQSMINSILKDPVTVKVSTGDSSGDAIDQEVIRLKPGEDKFKVLHGMLSDNEFSKVLLFEETKHRVSRLCMKLNKSGIQAEQIHGNKSQNARQNALKAFKQGRVQVLVATDVAARGLDVSDVSHVINYQVPQTHDSYIHRIGRTGRAGKIGKAYTFVA